MILAAMQHPLIPEVPAQPRLALSATFLVLAVLVQLGMLLTVGSLRTRLWDRIRTAPQLLSAPEQAADALAGFDQKLDQLATEGALAESDPTSEVDAPSEETYDREISQVDLSIFR
jgi:hypothetical protein